MGDIAGLFALLGAPTAPAKHQGREPTSVAAPAPHQCLLVPLWEPGMWDAFPHHLIFLRTTPLRTTQRGTVTPLPLSLLVSKIPKSA